MHGNAQPDGRHAHPCTIYATIMWQNAKIFLTMDRWWASLNDVIVGPRKPQFDTRIRHGGAENAGLESDELRLKQPQTSSTIDVSELSQNCVGVLHEVVDVRVHFCSKVPYYESNFCRIGLSAETSP